MSAACLLGGQQRRPLHCLAVHIVFLPLAAGGASKCVLTMCGGRCSFTFRAADANTCAAHLDAEFTTRHITCMAA